jgi:hypothetical protein
MKRGALSLGGGWRAALLVILMASGTFTYGPSGSPAVINPPIDYVRGLIADTQEYATVNGVQTPVFIFSDTEITMFTQMQSALGWQSTQFYSPPGGAFLPTSPTPYLRIAATMLRSIAANKARLASIQQLLDVKLDASKAAAALEVQAQSYLDMDDNSGAIAIVEACNDYFSFRDRFWKQVQRQSGA